VKRIAATGTAIDTAQVPGPNGHLNGVLALGQVAGKITAFLGK